MVLLSVYQDREW